MYRYLEGPDIVVPSTSEFYCTVSLPPPPFETTSWEVAYIPVHQAIDRTPFREPLMKWAGIWRVEDSMKTNSLYREIYREFGA